MTTPDEPPDDTPAPAGSWEPMPADPAGSGPPAAHGAPGGYGAPAAYGGVPSGMYAHPGSGVLLPAGVELASVGRRIGAYFLAIPLVVVTLGIGYLVWGLVAWGRGTSPALQVLGMRCWVPGDQRVAGFWRMALRDVVGGIATVILTWVTALVSFILFLSQRDHRSLADYVGGTVVVHDPHRVLG